MIGLSQPAQLCTAARHRNARSCRGQGVHPDRCGVASTSV